MNIFNTPDWESSQIGNENALQLFKTKNVKTKASKKSTRKNSKKANLKKREYIYPKEKVALNHARKSEGENFKNKKKLATVISKINNKKQISKNRSVANINKKNLNNPEIGRDTRIAEKSIVNNTQKNLNDEQVTRKFTKQKIRMKKKNKINACNELKLNEDLINVSNKHNQKKRKLKKNKFLIDNKINNLAPLATSKRSKLIKLLSLTPSVVSKINKPTSLKDRLIEKLKGSRFRYINEQIYNSEGKDAQKYFRNDPDAFYAYHEGYRQQVSKWPLNPVDVIIKSIRKMPVGLLIADFGCGEAKLAKSVPHTVYSYDLVAANDCVTACNMSRVPLEHEKVDVVVFCLSLMGTNIREYLFEANRVLKNGGILKIAEIESRFDTIDVFIDGVKQFGFAHTWKDLSHNLFYFLDFKKTSKCKPLHKLPTVGLHPCLYKKR